MSGFLTFPAILKHGQSLILGTVVLGLLGWYLQHKGYQKGYQQAELRCEAEKAAQSQSVAERLAEIQQEYQQTLNELQSRNSILSSRLDDSITNTRDIVNTRAEEINNVTTTGDCSLDYNAVRLLDSLATDPTP